MSTLYLQRQEEEFLQEKSTKEMQEKEIPTALSQGRVQKVHGQYMMRKYPGMYEATASTTVMNF